jgi:4a-hydroxytetrahydrobiopterin dehydratase
MAEASFYTPLGHGATGTFEKVFPKFTQRTNGIHPEYPHKRPSLFGSYYAAFRPWRGLIISPYFGSDSRVSPQYAPHVEREVLMLAKRCPIREFNLQSGMSLLNSEEISASLARLPAWKQEEKNIVRTFELKDFVVAIKFVNQVAEKAEAAWHHPDIDIRWNKVRLALSTHSEGGLTEKDFALAEEFDGLA